MPTHHPTEPFGNIFGGNRLMMMYNLQPFLYLCNDRNEMVGNCMPTR